MDSLQASTDSGWQPPSTEGALVDLVARTHDEAKVNVKQTAVLLQHEVVIVTVSNA